MHVCVFVCACMHVHVCAYGVHKRVADSLELQLDTGSYKHPVVGWNGNWIFCKSSRCSYPPCPL